MCVKVNSLFDSDTKVCCVTLVFKQVINFKMMCPDYIPKFRNEKSH